MTPEQTSQMVFVVVSGSIALCTALVMFVTALVHLFNKVNEKK
jgi:hypothetical protein